MRSYYHSRKTRVHKISLQLETDEAVKMLEEFDCVDLTDRPNLAKAREMLERSFAKLEADLP